MPAVAATHANQTRRVRLVRNLDRVGAGGQRDAGNGDRLAERQVLAVKNLPRRARGLYRDAEKQSADRRRRENASKHRTTLLEEMRGCRWLEPWPLMGRRVSHLGCTGIRAWVLPDGSGLH